MGHYGTFSPVIFRRAYHKEVPLADRYPDALAEGLSREVRLVLKLPLPDNCRVRHTFLCRTDHDNAGFIDSTKQSQVCRYGYDHGLAYKNDAV